MQPQEPTNPLGQNGPQTPAPPTPPVPSQQPVMPSSSPSPAPVTSPAPVMPPQSGPQPFQPSPSSTPTPQMPPAGPTPFAHPAPAPQNKKKLTMLIVIIVAAIIVIGGGVLLAMQLMGNKLALKEFSNENLSLLVPADYEQNETNGSMEFKEKGTDDTTRSEVVALSEKFEEATETQLDQIRDQLKKSLESDTSDSLFGGSVNITNVKVSDITFKGSEAFRATGDATKDGKKIGEIILVAGIKDKTLFMVGVAAHESDKALSKKANDIINSFSLK